MDFLTLEDGTDRLSRNVGKELPVCAALYPRRGQMSSASWQKSEIMRTAHKFSKLCRLSVSALPEKGLNDVFECHRGPNSTVLRSAR